MSISRRAVLGTLAAAGLAAAKARHAFDKPIGAELYTVRTLLPKDAKAALARIHQIGYTEVETQRDDLLRLAPLFKEYGLAVPAAHFDTSLVIGGPASGVPAGYTWERAIEEAKSHGLHYMVVPYVSPQLRKGPDAYREYADKMNHAGEQCAKAGLEFCYHNHAFEFGGDPGTRPWDIFMERWDKKLVKLELDVFWLSVSGRDPVESIREMAGRVPLVHLKDKAQGFPVQHDEKVPAATFREVGKGSLDFAAILRAAEHAGVKHYFVEQDQTSGNPLESLQTSYNNLRHLQV